MSKNNRLLQVIDSETGEIVREELLHWDEDFFIKRGVDNIYASGYYTDKYYVRSFAIKKYMPFFRKHPELFYYTRMLAEWLVPDSGILRRISEPYRWRHFQADMNCDHTTCYRIREKLMAYGLVGEVKVFGTKHLCINPFLFGKGQRVIKEVAEYFRKKGAEIRGTINWQLGKKR